MKNLKEEAKTKRKTMKTKNSRDCPLIYSPNPIVIYFLCKQNQRNFSDTQNTKEMKIITTETAILKKTIKTEVGEEFID